MRIDVMYYNDETTKSKLEVLPSAEVVFMGGHPFNEQTNLLLLSSGSAYFYKFIYSYSGTYFIEHTSATIKVYKFMKSCT